jgi:tetratricopeptide (TPR) repeat protein
MNDPRPAAGTGDRLARLLEMALGWYDRALASDPAYCYAYFHKARSLEELDRADEACATLRTGIDAARRAGDSHALGEMRGYLDQLE